MTTPSVDIHESSALAAALEELAPKVPDPQGQQTVPQARSAVSRNGSAPQSEGSNPEPGTPGDPDKAPVTLEGLDVSAILKDPVLGPKIQSWADKEVALPQITAALNRERARLETEIGAKKDDEVLREYFGRLSKQELAEVLADDEEMAIAYARLQADKKQAVSSADEEAVANAARSYAYLTVISATNKRIEEAQLPAEVKSTLDPAKYAPQGDAGIVAWVKAVDDALLQQSLQPLLQKALEEKWEAYLEEKSAELGQLRPGATPRGVTASPLPDLLATPSLMLLEDAFQAKR